MKSRFIVKKVKIVWRNSMLAGNPIERSFTKFGIYDRNWQHDCWCYCPRPDGEWLTNNGQSHKFRLVVDEEDKAKRITSKLNELATAIGEEKCAIAFGVSKPDGVYPLSNYIQDEDIEHIVITKSSLLGNLS